MLQEVVELGFHHVSGPGSLVQDEVADFVEARYLHTGFVIFFFVCVCVSLRDPSGCFRQGVRRWVGR